ncbi:DNA repair helicase XPB [Paenibacillus sp. FSL W7-1287]|uniref:DNA repair helicase XPB n=1 Tax=Paenibacillus sp. FSL W7-1287 TaxID=2954538 RepID=UPI0030F695B7
MQRRNVLIVQRDMTLLLDREAHYAAEARSAIGSFTELLKVLGQFEVYECTPVTVWNALALGLKCEKIIDVLHTYAKGALPAACESQIKLWASRFGRLTLLLDDQQLIMQGDEAMMQELESLNLGSSWIEAKHPNNRWIIKQEGRGFLKQELAKAGYAVQDLVGYHDGEAVHMELRQQAQSGASFHLRDYQRKAIAAFHRDRVGGSGVIVLPCGSGKTVTGIGVMASLQTATLIVTSSVTSAKQWRDELLDKTSLSPEDIGLYGGKARSVEKITIATYTILTHRNKSTDQYDHMKLFSERDWGLIIYDEVQLLPAPIFRMTAMIQATRRLGLTATLIREDGCANDVFSLVGPKLYDLSWKKAEEQSYIAKVHCTEVRVKLPAHAEEQYNTASARLRLKIAAINPNKIATVKQIMRLHPDLPTLIIGQYIEQLKEMSVELGVPLLTGSTDYEQREAIFKKFRNREISTLVVSRIANLAVDLPDAAVAIQVSGSFGSRQEEAQRIGRLLRPKRGANEAWFYTLVTEGSKETEFALKRGLFMLEQGYQYRCIHEQEVFL